MDGIGADPASMNSSRLSLATRSERHSEPALIRMALVATARSAMAVSSVSPERCDATAESPARVAKSTAAKASPSVPIWFGLIRIAQPPSGCPASR